MGFRVSTPQLVSQSVLLRAPGHASGDCLARPIALLSAQEPSHLAEGHYRLTAAPYPFAILPLCSLACVIATLLKVLQGLLLTSRCRLNLTRMYITIVVKTFGLWSSHSLEVLKSIALQSALHNHLTVSQATSQLHQQLSIKL